MLVSVMRHGEPSAQLVALHTEVHPLMALHRRVAGSARCVALLDANEIRTSVPHCQEYYITTGNIVKQDHFLLPLSKRLH